MAKTVVVGMAQAAVASAPELIETKALGSCVGVILYDPIRKVGGLAHPMLPIYDPSRVTSEEGKLKFVDSSIDFLLSRLKTSGAKRDCIWAKIAGGANMFPDIFTKGITGVGEKNIESAKSYLKKLGIRIIAKDVGGSVGRTIIFDTSTGVLNVRSIKFGQKDM